MGLLDLIKAPRSEDASGLLGHLLNNGSHADVTPDLGDRIIAGAHSFAGSHALLPALLNGVQGFATGHRTDRNWSRGRIARSAPGDVSRLWLRSTACDLDISRPRADTARRYAPNHATER